MVWKKSFHGVEKQERRFMGQQVGMKAKKGRRVGRPFGSVRANPTGDHQR